MKYTYLLINIISLLFPFAFSFERRISFYKSWKYLFPAILITAFIFIGWDIWFTSLGVWSFNANYLMGIYLFNLPLEEIMFFFAIPYASIFLYEVLIFKVFTLPIGKKFDHISLVLALIFIIIACLNWTKAYTFSAFLLCGLFIAFLFFRKSNTLIRFYLFYLVLIFPFVIVNGLLTGSFLNRVVVVYNNVENLGLRFMTIPIEDFVFGILLMLININLYEYFKSRY